MSVGNPAALPRARWDVPSDTVDMFATAQRQLETAAETLASGPTYQGLLDSRNLLDEAWLTLHQDLTDDEILQLGDDWVHADARHRELSTGWRHHCRSSHGRSSVLVHVARLAGINLHTQGNWRDCSALWLTGHASLSPTGEIAHTAFGLDTLAARPVHRGGQLLYVPQWVLRDHVRSFLTRTGRDRIAGRWTIPLEVAETAAGLWSPDADITSPYRHVDAAVLAAKAICGHDT